MDKEGKYRFSSKERDEREIVSMHFREWLNKHAGKEAADVFLAIQVHYVTSESYRGWPVKEMTVCQKRFITETKTMLARAAGWLKAQASQ